MCKPLSIMDIQLRLRDLIMELQLGSSGHLTPEQVAVELGELNRALSHLTMGFPPCPCESQDETLLGKDEDGNEEEDDDETN